MNEQIVDSLHVRDKLVIACLPLLRWPVFCSFLTFCCYFTRLMIRISWKDIRVRKILVILYSELCDN